MLMLLDNSIYIRWNASLNRFTIMLADLDKLLFNLILLIICTNRVCESSLNINKCCPGDQQFNEKLQCSKTTKSGTAIKILSRLAIDEEYDKFNFTAKNGVIPCGGREFLFKSSDWYKLDEDGNLKLLDDNDNIVSVYSKTSYCVERWNLDESENIDIAYICPCLENLCISKCCPIDSQMYTKKDDDGGVTARSCKLYSANDGVNDWKPSVLNGSSELGYHELIYKTPNCSMSGRKSLYLRGTYFVREDGSLWSASDGVISAGDYCGDYVYSGNGSKRLPKVLACVADEDSIEQLIFFAVLTFIGSFFLFMTVLLYLWLPELSGLHSRCLVAHASCLLIGYLCTIPSRFGAAPNHHYSCFILGYLMQFSFLASFFWLNIMCVDMSHTFSSLRVTSKSVQRQNQKRRFIWYSLYAWGGTSLFTLAALITDFSPTVPSGSPFKPNLGAVKCWFNTTESLLLYFYGPMGILLVANLILFIYTTWRIIVMSRGSSALNHGDSARHGGPSNKEKQRYVLYAKMFSLMGVTWLTEILSWAVGGPSYIWYLTDCINLLRAVFIFIIFCWKPRVWKAVKRNYKHIKCFFVNKFGMIGNRKTESQIDDHSEPSTDSTETTNKCQEAKLEMKPDK